MITVISSFFILVFPTNYQLPRHKEVSTPQAVCAAEIGDEVKVYRVDLVSDAKCIGCEVKPVLTKVVVDCTGPKVTEVKP